MAQHTNVLPLTAQERLDYSQQCRELAAQQRQEGDLFSAEINDWMADNYAKPADRPR